MPTELERVLAQSRSFVDEMVHEELNGKPFSKSTIEKSIYAFYAMQKQPRPQIVWFQNPWQLHYGPGMFLGYKRKQILVDRFISELLNTVRGLLEEQMGKRETGYILSSIQSIMPARSLSLLSRTIDTEIEILDRANDRHSPALGESLFKAGRSAVLDVSSKLQYADYAEKVGSNIGWYSLKHVTDLPCPWEHIIVSTNDHSGMGARGRSHLGWDIWGELRPPQDIPFHLPTPGAEWSHFMRMRMAAVTIAHRFIGLKLADELAEAANVMQTLAQSVHSLACFPEVCFVSEPPVSISRDEQGRFHHLNGPAIKYAGAFEIYCWRDTRVAPHALQGEVTVERIQREDNLEVMRILLERYGIEEFLRDSNAQHIQEDEAGVLYKIGRGGLREEPITLVGVVNSTAEPDGTFKRYFLRVPPTTQSAKEGVAWTFNLTTDEYAPLVQT